MQIDRGKQIDAKEEREIAQIEINTEGMITSKKCKYSNRAVIADIPAAISRHQFLVHKPLSARAHTGGSVTE